MSKEADQTEPSEESLREIPEVDFSKGIRPNRYANLRGELERAVYLPKELWDHFGSEEKVVEALKRLADASRDEGGRGAAE